MVLCADITAFAFSCFLSYADCCDFLPDEQRAAIVSRIVVQHATHVASVMA